MKHLAFDTETTVVDLDAGEIPDLVCGVFHEPGGSPFLLDAADTVRFVSERIADPETVFVMHVAPFDWTVLWRTAPHLKRAIVQLYDDRRIRDTLTRQQLLDVADGLASDSNDDAVDSGGRTIFRKINGVWVKSGLSLADLAFYHLGKDRYADKKDPNSPRMRFGELVGVPVAHYPAEFSNYALADATDTWEVYVKQGPDLLPNEAEQMRPELVLRRISQRGMRVNPERTAALKAKAVPEYDKIRAAMTDAGFYRGEGSIDPDTEEPWKAARIGTKNKGAVEVAVLAAYKKLGAPVPRTKKGNVSCDKDSLLRSEDPLLKELSGSGPLGTTVNTFIPLLEGGKGGRVRSRFNNLLATGRISSAKPNLNNIPRDGGVRECFESEPGMVLCSADYDCAELRSHAQVNLWVTGKSAMAEFFQKNPTGDPHLELAASILKIDSAEAYRRKDADDKEVTGVRQMCKALNFGLPGGMGAERLRDAARRQYRVVMDVREAKQRKAQWHRRWPEMRRYFNIVTQRSNSRSRIEQLAPPGHGPHRVRGRSPHEPGRWFSQIANTYFQGLTADGAKDALWRVWKACEVEETSPLYGSHIVGFLYDELILEVPEARAHEAAMELSRLMIEGMQAWVPDVPITAKPTLSRVWSKKAKPVWVDGHLAPWNLR